MDGYDFSHYILLLEGRGCTFVNRHIDDFTFTENGDVAEMCGQPAAYLASAVYHRGRVSELCATHAAHARACPQCASVMESMQTGSCSRLRATVPDVPRPRLSEESASAAGVSSV